MLRKCYLGRKRSFLIVVSGSVFVSMAFIIFNNSDISVQPPVTSCVMPLLQPEILKDRLKPWPECSAIQPPNPVRIFKGRIKADKYFNNSLDLNCSYVPIIFQTDFQFTSVDSDVKYLPPNEWVPCKDENMFVKCQTLVNGAASVVFKLPMRCIFQRQDVAVRHKLHETSAVPANATLFNDRLNIILVGFDSMSHVGFVEQMPETMLFLQQELNAFVFDGYNIVGDGTTAAILGLTSGYLEEELHEARRGFAGAKQIDDFPLIFYQLADEGGYATLWDEEQIGAGTFHYRLLGFKKPPVDHYGRIFRGFDENNRWNGGKVYDDRCYGSQKHLDEQLTLVDQFFEAYPDPFRKFGLVFSSIYTHSSEGSGAQYIQLFDLDVKNKFKDWRDLGYLNNSLLIVFSDHGSRYSGSRATERGKIAERLPLLTMAFPQWFRDKYRYQFGNMQASTKLLTTPFDLHATLLDVAGLLPLPGTPNRGVSFFKPRPSGRDCESAGISPHWCMCLQPGSDSTLATNDPLAQKCVQAFEDLVNKDLLKRFIETNQCLEVTVTKILSAQRFGLRSEVATFVKTVDGHGRKPSFNSKNMKSQDLEYVQLSVLTKPGEGRFEITFEHQLSSGQIWINSKQISRTNRYGSAPRCIQEHYPHLRPFCYCSGFW